MSFVDHFMKHLRLTILRALNDAPGCSANASILKTVAESLGLPATRDQMHTAIDWLAEQGLVTKESVLNLIVAKLTERGRDVAEGRARVEGVARPGLGG
ncbi:VpaChn25_0724 family phage protein [Brevundimonas sp.]|uniref:VpaChn25_0724 family phage protein n=1 Tax=Brevundimonas sp. TaxID=1871086 RepID=UPI003F70F504